MLRASFERGDFAVSFGGIGATPDDHTRQSAAAALGVPLVRHPEAVAELEARFGADAYPNRVLMAEFPEGSRIIPNPVNRVPAFAIRDHLFLPGFPQIAWPTFDWALAQWYPELPRAPVAERPCAAAGAGRRVGGHRCCSGTGWSATPRNATTRPTSNEPWRRRSPRPPRTPWPRRPGSRALWNAHEYGDGIPDGAPGERSAQAGQCLWSG